MAEQNGNSTSVLGTLGHDNLTDLFTYTCVIYIIVPVIIST